MSSKVKNRVALVSLFLTAIVGLVGVAYIPYLFSTRVEAQSPQRLRLQAEEMVNGWGSMQVICDAETGNLIYRTGLGGLAVVPNGCQKNPR